MLETLMQAGFWLAVLQIIAIDILLGGDNAVVIALACRRLPEKQRRQGIFWGVAGAIAVRVVLIFFALQLLALPFLKLLGALLLVWIGIGLLRAEDDDAHGDIEARPSLLGAIRTVVVADVVMSLDNVVAVAGAAKGDIVLVAFGILISIPIIVWGSRFVLALMDRFPAVITLGAALLGWIAGEMALSDVVVAPLLAGAPGWIQHLAGATGALLVLALSRILGRRGGDAATALPDDAAAVGEEP
ncbi:TerC family protein [Azospira restricta]|uniref:TerC family protein n=1 Tax=Azospira restricta TaxID=404405 RepID=A0A974SNL2_9RHOO|nr:TerC family protein [Azospira restricta]QRJ63278.1 TerC family protein [Azospira restricta]